MAASVSISANYLMGGNSGFGAQGVFGRVGWAVWQNFSGSARREARADGFDVAVHASPGGGSRSWIGCAARFFKGTVFCGFQAVACRVVAWLPSHGRMESAVFCGFRAACRLIVSYPPAAGLQIGAAPACAPDQLAGAGGLPPFAGAPRSHPRRDRAGQEFEKPPEAASSALMSHGEVSGGAEFSRCRTGSGVRAAQGAQNSNGNGGFPGANGAGANGVRGEVAGHVPSDVAVVPMLCAAVNRVN